MDIEPGTQIGRDGLRHPLAEVASAPAGAPRGYLLERLNALEAGGALQPLDPDLTAIAALPTSTFGRSILSLADAAAARALLGTQVELGYAEIVANQTGIVSTAGVDITGLTTTVAIGTRPVEITVHLGQVYFTAGTAPLVAVCLIYEGATLVGRGQITLEGIGTGRVGTIRAFARRNPTPGPRTYKAQLAVAGTGASAQINASANGPASISVVER